MIKFKVIDKQTGKVITAPHIFLNGSGVVFENKREGMEGADDLVSTDRYEPVLINEGKSIPDLREEKERLELEVAIRELKRKLNISDHQEVCITSECPECGRKFHHWVKGAYADD